MNALGISLVWGAVQATLFLLLSGAAYMIARRHGPASGSLAVLASLQVAVGVSVLALLPWPTWYSVTSVGVRDELTETAFARRRVATGGSRESGAPEHAPGGTQSSGAQLDRGLPDLEPLAPTLWQAFWEDLRTADSGPSATVWRWPALLATGLLGGVVLALGRLALGLAAVSRFRQQTEPVTDPAVLALAGGLAQRLGCRRVVELRQSASVSAPATVGWRRPLVLLPEAWQSWSEDERRAVLAHELAHVARGDFLGWIAAQFSLACHFYHPLAHWLAGRLRLEQELAADARGSEASLGRERYLVTLAEMALKQDSRQVSWAARPFLSSHTTFIRRIEMLRNKNHPWASTAFAPAARAGLVAALAVAGLLVAGIRARDNSRSATAQAQEKPKPPAEAASTSIDLAYVPADAVVVIAVRPAEVFEKAGMQRLVEFLNLEAGLERQLGLGAQQFEEVKLIMTRMPAPGQPGEPVDRIIVRSKGPHGFDALRKAVAGETVQATFLGKTYHKPAVVNRRRLSVYQPDDRTLVMAPEEQLQLILATEGKAIKEPSWAEAWRSQATGQAAVMVDVAAVRKALEADLKKLAGTPQAALLNSFAPLWERADRFIAGVRVNEGFSIAAVAHCATPEDAQNVRQTADASMALARNALDKVGDQIAAAPAEQAAPLLALADLSNELVKQATIEVEGPTVSLQTQVTLDVADTAVAILLPAVQAAREAARRTQSMNNLKQIGLAMHNFHGVHNEFPPAVVIGPDRKTPHSWRIELLPYLEQKALYDQYKMDEPWDSESNLKVLEQMPPVYREPSDDPTKYYASYFVLTGDTTMFAGSKPIKLQEITDGTSNTIMTVEAKRNIPWTKPEDIAYDPSKPLPNLGGHHPNGFLAGFADGSVRFISKSIDQTVLRGLITRSGGEVNF